MRNEADDLDNLTAKANAERTTVMTLGEKIKFYRETMGITQSALSEMSGIGLSTIKKLECDLMNPKPNMLMKISDALSVSINIFTDFDINTVSDVMSLLTKMDEQIGMEFHAKYSDAGEPLPSSITISFTHPALTSRLADYVKMKDLQAGVIKDSAKYTDEADLNAIALINENLEKSRLLICRNNVNISKST